jgi:hypothetical protein
VFAKKKAIPSFDSCGWPLSSQRIAIVLAIPVAWEEFRDRAAAAWDYGRQVLRGRSPKQAFEAVYLPVCTAASRLLARASAMDLSVRRNADLNGLRSAVATHDVVILVAHWRGSRVESGDFVGDWREATKAAASAGPLAEILRPFLSAPAGPEPEMRAALAAALNSCIESRRLSRYFPSGVGDAIAVDPWIHETLSREVVDACFGGSLLAGNQLELADGLHSMGTVADAIGGGYHGVLDLSCCTSSILGTYLKIVCGDALDVILGEQLIVPGPQLQLIEAVLEIIQNDPNLEYARVRRTVGRALADWSRQPGKMGGRS